MSRHHIHAEYLQHVKTLNITATLFVQGLAGVKASVANDGSCFTVEIEGAVSSILLPARPIHRGALERLQSAQDRLEFRLPAEPLPGFDVVFQENVIPWSAQDLGPRIEMRCLKCDGLLVERGEVKEWKDLPSEGWADMMDFWHCHKPHDHHEGHGVQNTKGYAAGGKLVAKPGVGFVDVLGFLIFKADCIGVKVRLRCLLFIICFSLFFPPKRRGL